KNAKGLDSKSKLESKNPNKIQTTKIKDSKIQLKSNSPKLKDSNSKLESSKVKTLIRTIPVSIALASALSSQAVAVDGWQVHNISFYPNYNNGTIVSNPDATFGVAGNDIMVPVPNNGTINISAWNQVVRYVYYVSGGTAGDLTIQQGTTFRMLYLYDAFIKVGLGNGNVGSVGTILNQGTILKSNDTSVIGIPKSIIDITENSSFDAIVNEGRIVSQNGNTTVRSQIIKLRNNSQGNLLKNTGTIIGSGDLIRIESSSLGKIELSGGLLQVDSGNVIGIQGSSNIGTITADDATINGSINLAGTSSITNGISLDNQSKMTGGITLGDSSNIAGISLANASTITGNVTLNGSSSIDNISISGNNASLSGNITIGTARGNSASIDNITISNGGTYAGTIHTRNQTSIDSITIASGGVVGSVGSASTILSSGNSTIHNIDIQDGGTMYGNIEAHWIPGGNANNEQDSSGVLRDGNIGDVSIAGRLQGDIVLQTKVFMNSLTMSDNGTITGNIRIGATGDSSQTPTLSTITLSDNSGINAIVLGNNDARATINSITLNNNSSIGTITNNSNATIVNLTLNDTSTITNGITNDSNIGSLDLQNNTTYSGTGSITNALDIANSKTLNATNNGINILFANNATGTINNAGIISGSLNNQNGSTIKSFNTGSINGSIINNADATIETLNVTGNVANGITNNSNIGSLIVKESVSYSGSGSITNKIDVESGDTLTAGSGITFNSTNGTINNAGTILGSIDNGSNSTISIFTNTGTIDGDINNNGTITHFTNSGSISGTFTNKGH
ncbi:beta strand repeat-containing protein, partial [Helicobacter pullorum]|uniref:beta strand repeat-containing protein n=2 Tax=Helicobacter pullorum TaxID=35818 RepID=UPI000A912D64